MNGECLDGVTVGIRDVTLQGEMKDLLTKVTEAKKAAEATLIARREETAAMPSQVEPSGDSSGLEQSIEEPFEADDFDEYEDSIAEGLDPDEVDWESHDYE